MSPQMRYWKTSLKIFLSLGLIIILYYQIEDKLAAIDFKTLGNIQFNIWALVLAILLIPINIWLEATKFKILLGSRPSILLAIKSILAGFAAGIVTPGRVGEYGGRLLFIGPKDRTVATLATFVGSIGQNLVNMTLGVAGALMFCRYYTDILEGLPQWFWHLFIASIVLLTIFFFNIERFVRLLKNLAIPWLSRTIGKIKEGKRDITRGVLKKVLIFSVLRYLVYLSQYVMITWFFDFEVSVTAAILSIAMIYLIQSALPLPMLLSVVARGEIALLVWSVFGIDPAVILAATFSLWIINLVMPAVLGVLIINKNPILPKQS